jgi:hypothetical protein
VIRFIQELATAHSAIRVLRDEPIYIMSRVYRAALLNAQRASRDQSSSQKAPRDNAPRETQWVKYCAYQHSFIYSNFISLCASKELVKNDLISRSGSSLNRLVGKYKKSMHLYGWKLIRYCCSVRIYYSNMTGSLFLFKSKICLGKIRI